MIDPIQVRDCMIRPSITLKGDMMVAEAATKLIENKSIGAPVVDDNGDLIGWLSEYDCLKVLLQVAYYDQRIAIVSDVMQSPVKTVTEDQSALDLAPTMHGNSPKLYPVVNTKGKLIGIVSRRLILHRLCEIAVHHDIKERA